MRLRSIHPRQKKINNELSELQTRFELIGNGIGYRNAKKLIQENEKRINELETKLERIDEQKREYASQIEKARTKKEEQEDYLKKLAVENESKQLDLKKAEIEKEKEKERIKEEEQKRAYEVKQLEKEVKQLDLENAKVESSSKEPFNLPLYIDSIGFPNNPDLFLLRDIVLGDYDKKWKDRFKRLCEKLPALNPVEDSYDLDYLTRLKYGIELGLKRGTCAKEMDYTNESREIAQKTLNVLGDYIRRSGDKILVAA